MFGFINRVVKIIWPPLRDSSADVSTTVSSSTERIRSEERLAKTQNVSNQIFGVAKLPQIF